ncbi:phage holin family protein [Arthrobacter agilis]|uniref:phage holin family protein n=1 Tax=Arthrobacter agilis TaxID=37921 RepID=UPI0023668F16|nr:phage holin family protein [Arthrobacter agilis]WDF34353.1 phage holin family protein [Arthrobacter agilis]
MNSSASMRGKRSTGSISLFGLIRLLARLTPRQISDEVSIALQQMKQKGIKAGIAAAFLVVALVFVLFFAVALVVAAIMGLAEIMPAWLAALLVALLFLVIGGILALIGVSRFKKQLPLVPEDAIRGIRYDLGVLKEGRSFDPATLDVKKPKEDKGDKKSDADAQDSKPKEPTPSYEELRGRSGERRTHIAEVRDSLGARVDVKARLEGAKHRSQDANSRKVASGGRGTGASIDGIGERVAAVAVRREVPLNTTLADRWKPLSVLGASVAAMLVMLRRLLSR